ncbi:hypothetical protein ACTMTJ_35785 [Phytohabitans sp. LJ34]|uniref:hypothetical protein n=1 Tax=Phytohabitans sp. LJ34 TaxID=3452217 RepID=UPI003F8A2963
MSVPARILRPDPLPARPGPVTGGRPPWWRRSGAPLLLLLSGPTVLLLAALDAPARAVPVILYVLAVPGIAVVRLIGVADRLMETMLGVGLSLALGMLVTQIMVYTGVWSPMAALAILVAIATACLAPALRRGAP